MLKESELNHLTPLQAYDILANDSKALLIDIRSNMEYLFVGHPKGAIHVPWIDEPDWIIDPNFSTIVRQLLLGGVSEDEVGPAVILICRSGKRSTDAGQLLLQKGLKYICHVTQGFEGELDANHHRSSSGGWRHHDLPWEQC
jgi:rhodanese-related sulfurtransferase